MHTIAEIKHLCQESSHLHGIEMELAALSKESQEARNIEGVLVIEAKVKTLQEELPKLFSKDNTAADIATKKQYLAASDKTGEKSSAFSEDYQQRLPPGGGQAVNTYWARLNYLDSRLLLHTPSSHTDSLLYMKLPTEVFLQVSIRNRCLGRVYIRLWCHLRRAQHFQAICNGTLGPTYVGASFTISSHGQEREALDIPKYVLPNGDKSSKVLMTELEWGGRFTGPANEGVVMGSCHGEDTHGCGICTRGQPGGTFKCPFGEVLSGMDIVKAAINHEPISEVTISDCGLVIPEFFQP
ncbi:uncharacterized protein [Panulirus ornatus]|uniref:uncharacterized protein n=1 Tax=Panulirus ornatus TaxID=150431 RepID=UPI003A8B6FAA